MEKVEDLLGKIQREICWLHQCPFLSLCSPLFPSLFLGTCFHNAVWEGGILASPMETNFQNILSPSVISSYFSSASVISGMNDEGPDSLKKKVLET